MLAPVRWMASHWSGAEVGEYFDVTIKYDPLIYSESEVVVPFCRAGPMGLPSCMLEDVDFNVKSSAGDSRYHIELHVRKRVEPLS